MKTFFIACLGCVALLTVPQSQAALQIVTTTEDLAAIAKAVGGDHIRVHSLTPGSRDPHFAQAKPSMIRKVYGADLLLLIGADMEIGWLPPLLRSGRNSQVLPGNPGYLDLSTTVTLLGKPTEPITRDMGDVHAQGNPHYWLDPKNGLLMAKAITERLIILDPDHNDAYQSNLVSFQQRLMGKMKEWQSTLMPLKGSKVIAYHTSLIYLATAFGFQIIDEVEPKPGISPTAAHLNRLIKRIEDSQIKLLIMEPFYEQRSARFLQDKTGIRIGVIPQSVGAKPGIDDYIQLFDAIVTALKQTGTL